MLDIEGVDGITLFEKGPGVVTPARIFFTYKDMRSRTVDFDTNEEASAMYESLFRLLMPDVAEAMVAAAAKEQTNGEA